MELKSRICLITGGTKGIGAATAVTLAQQGADVSIVARRADDEAQATQKQIESLGRRCLLITADMGKAEDCRRCAAETTDKLGSVDVLVHSAGGNIPGRLLEISPEAWYEAFEVHVHAIFHLCREIIPAMQRKKQGSIVLISSVAGIRGIPINFAYQVVKGVIPQLARGLAREFADDNIRVNAVAPGIIRTAFHARMSPDQKKHNLENRVPLHREGTPEQVADLIRELVTNEYITGETVAIDGGLTMRLA